MKAILYAGILLILVALICGCTTTPPPEETRPPAPKIPDLRGEWSGSSVGYVGDRGFTDYGGALITMKVTDQKDRVFHGQFLVTNRTGVINKTIDFGGVIGRDDMTLTIVERYGGYSFGSIISPDEIELTYADNSEPFEVAIDTMKRTG